jgi:hypothetical protein
MRALVLLGGSQFDELAPRTIAMLQRELKKASLPFCRALIDTLSELGSDGAVLLSKLVRRGDELQWDAVEALARMGDVAESLWIDTFERSDSDGRVAILATIGQSSHFAPSTVLELTRRGLQDEDAGVRVETTSAVTRYAPLLTPLVDEFISALLRERKEQALGLRPAPSGCDDGLYFVDDYVEAIGNLGPAAKSAIAILMKMLDDPDDDIRDHAFRAILKIAPSPAIGARLLEMYRQTAITNGVPNREWASSLVASGLDERMMTVVTGWLFDEHSRAIEAAAELIGSTKRNQRDTVKYLVLAYDHADTQAKLAILGALKELDVVEECLPVLLKSLQDNDQSVRLDGMTLLCHHRCDDPKVISTLLEMRDSLAPEERMGVEVSLHILGVEHQESLVSRLLDSLETEDPFAADCDVERWLISIGRPAVDEILDRLVVGRLTIDRALSLLENEEFELTSEVLAPFALRLLRSGSNRLQFAGADLMRRFPVDASHAEIVSCLWRLVGSDHESIRAYAADAFERISDAQSECPCGCGMDFRIVYSEPQD